MLQWSGCYYFTPNQAAKQYLPQVKNRSCTTILATASRTSLQQTFVNLSPANIGECIYTFPLYEGVSVVDFTCRVGSRLLRGRVQEKSKARETYDQAVARGETAGILEQLPEASDVFSTRLGNIPASATVHVELTYIGELKHDAEANGIRFTLPTAIAPRYGTQPPGPRGPGGVSAQEEGGIEITVDVKMPEGSSIQGIQSPSHPIAVTLGKTSTSTTPPVSLHCASATLSSTSTELDRDFVLVVQITEQNAPKALLERHTTIPNHRALMMTLVPNFSLPPSRPEIVFVVDRSGSMASNIPTLKSALQVFLKSLPVGVKFNICSFGSEHSFLWPRSKAYSHESLQEAMVHVQGFAANMGGTETFGALKATIENRFADLACELILLTDGDIWDQSELFSYVDKQVKASKGKIRIFSLGIGGSVSHALVEGIARAGNGFAQTVGEQEKFDKKVVRMLKGALSPHLSDCELEVKFERSEDKEDDFELVEKVTDSLKVLLTRNAVPPQQEAVQKPISFYDEAQSSDRTDVAPSAQNANVDRYAHLPAIPAPTLLQTPSMIASLFSFSRTVIYILLSEKAVQQTPKSVVLRASSAQGPLELTVPVEEIAEPGETIHQLAARKTIQEFEEGRGWIFDSRDETGALLRDKFPGQFDEIVERESVRLGTKFQVSGKWLAFVAVAENGQEMPDRSREDEVSQSGTTYSNSTPFGGFSSLGQTARGAQFCSTGYGSSTFRNQSQDPPTWNAQAQHTMGHQAQHQQQLQQQQMGQQAFAGFASATPVMHQRMQSSTLQTLSPFGVTSGAQGFPGGSGEGALFGGRGPPDSWGVGGHSGGWRGGHSGGCRGGHSGGWRGGHSGGGRGGHSGGWRSGHSGGCGGGLLSVGGASRGGLFGAPVPLSSGSDGWLSSDSRSIPCSRGASSADTIVEKRESDIFKPRKRKAIQKAPCRPHQSKLSMSPRDKVLHGLIALQTFTGSWEANDDVIDILGIPQEKLGLEDKAGEGRGGGAKNLNAWITLLVVRFLENYMPEDKEVWELVVDKAKQWLVETGMPTEWEIEVDGILKEVKG